jgi:predicted Na+-dependent transporter
VVSRLAVNIRSIIGVIGTGGILAILIFLVVSLACGYLLGGREAGIRSVLGLGTAQRNLSAAFLVAVQNFADDPNVLVMNIVTGMVGLVLLMVIAGELGKRSQGEV